MLCPSLHEGFAALKHVGSGVGGFGAVSDGVAECRFGEVSGDAGVAVGDTIEPSTIAFDLQ